jgi:hypothetical protein
MRKGYGQAPHTNSAPATSSQGKKQEPRRTGLELQQGRRFTRLEHHCARGRLFPKDGTNVTPKMGRSYLGSATIPCYTRAPSSRMPLLSPQLSRGYQQLACRKSGPELTTLMLRLSKHKRRTGLGAMRIDQRVSGDVVMRRGVCARFASGRAWPLQSL